MNPRQRLEAGCRQMRGKTPPEVTSEYADPHDSYEAVRLLAAAQERCGVSLPGRCGSGFCTVNRCASNRAHLDGCACMVLIRRERAAGRLQEP